MPRDSDILEMEQKIYLGGQISQKYKIFQDIARMTPQYAKPYFIIKNMDRWEKMTEDEVILEIIEFLGEVEFVNQCTELSKLSMVMGDTRKRINIKEGIDDLRHSEPDSST
ncbi:hypothetical protein MUP77_16150 [Candidatus Bathyarchaeota archaeon]|nr:hypothetical protein [Candidatus Bathyarchaeota archaeon]